VSYRPESQPHYVRHRVALYRKHQPPGLLANQIWRDVLRYYRRLRQGLRMSRHEANLMTIGRADALFEMERISLVIGSIYDRKVRAGIGCRRCGTTYYPSPDYEHVCRPLDAD